MFLIWKTLSRKLPVWLKWTYSNCSNTLQISLIVMSTIHRSSTCCLWEKGMEWVNLCWFLHLSRCGGKRMINYDLRKNPLIDCISFLRGRFAHKLYRDSLWRDFCCTAWCVSTHCVPPPLLKKHRNKQTNHPVNTHTHRHTAWLLLRCFDKHLNN